ncbi:PDR/VanB family oxidoreductase [Arthrobacter crystallopoietes]|uniref:Ferredoxin-NADP reductase n=1 Tax=Crystallibacter crystallopoietes TaxID=37928 RepID=A0A1H1AGE3_9MICC|nr:PDR/VanB family oxidoreductase [Arthrobacter crystallopoietes]AUI51543.1 oxidoreductase [Arthrobacter crystallopoietes]SDQ38611.1 Ferredoxin-NADP reductase [Arthrobacter crystallopoietes]
MNEEFFDVEVRSIQRESSSVVSLRLEHPLGEELPEWKPGSHVDVLLPNGILRQYSLCSKTADRAAWRLGVLREAEGRGGSAYVHDELKPGTKIQLRGPRNNFALEAAAGYVFIAGGIGITPVLPMVRDAAERGVPWRLVYLGRSRESMAFLEEIQALGGNVEIHADDESGLYPLAELLGGLDAGTHVYACGPGPLLNVLQSIADGWEDPARFHCERFTASGESPSLLKSGNSSFVVELTDGTEIPVGPGESILQALESAGINQPNSCREGICGTCETGVLGGEIDHRDSLLSDDERAAQDTMMICVSRCKGKRLLLDL